MTTERKEVLSDVDGVLADFVGAALPIMNAVAGKEFRREDFKTWDIFDVLSDDERREVFIEIEKPGFCERIEPFPGAVEGIRDLQKLVNVYPVTSPLHSMSWVYERAIWLRERFGWHRNEIVHTDAKFLVAGDALLDDKPAHVVSWKKRHPRGLAMLWNTFNTRPLSEMDSFRVFTWEEVLSRVEELVRAG